MAGKIQNIALTILLVAVILAIVITLAVVLTVNDDDDSSSTDTTRIRLSGIIDTVCGKVEGKIFNVTTDDGQNKSVYTFKGIPYAVPPVKELRWKAPVALDTDKSKCWSGTLNYSDNNIICKQAGLFQGYISGWENSTEDCLILNVRTPAVYKTAKLPVLIWIHGGAFVVGYGEQPYYHPDEQFTASLNVVTVTVNYRLGLFGFLSLEELWKTTGEDKSYTNFAVMDNILALKWVKSNIANFGGNPDDITLFGQSSGGSIVYSMVTSDLSRGLFTKAISASAGSVVEKSYKEANIEYRGIINTWNCSQGSSEAVEECLQNLNADIVLTFANLTTILDQFVFPFNVPLIGLPLIVTDPVVIPQGPGMLPNDVGGSLSLLITGTAQEMEYFFPINNYNDLNSTLKSRIDSFKNGLYPQVLDMYLNSSDKIMPINVTAKYIYETMTSDVLVICSTFDVGTNLSLIPNYDVYKAVVAQYRDVKPGRPIKYANHILDMHIMFSDGKLFGEMLTENELKLRSNLREVYKKFIYSDASFKSEYKDQPFVFWNNTIVKLDHPYHERECDVWRENGFLKYAWQN